MKKILFGICTEGSGHTIQAIATKQFLNKYNYDVSCVLCDEKKVGLPKFFTDEFSVITFEGFDFVFDNILITRECIHTTLNNKRYLIIHGDQFDGIVTKNKWIQKIGAIIYDFSLGINKLFRVFKFSFSNFLKQKAKEAVKYIGNYEDTLSEYCKLNEYDGVICGHIHAPTDKQMNNIHYINTGDFVESLTAVIETVDGEIKLIKL